KETVETALAASCAREMSELRQRRSLKSAARALRQRISLKAPIGLVADGILGTTMSTSNDTERAWKQVHGALLHYFQQRVGDEHAAEDLLQEVFLRVHSNLDNLKSRDRLHGWVFGIAKNLVVDYYRRKTILPFRE